MVIATTELSLISMGMKGGAKGLNTFVGTNAGILCRRTSSVPWLLSPPVAATSRSRFSTYALIHRNNSSLRSRDSDVGFTRAVCTIGTHYPTKGSWGCKVKPTTQNLTSAFNIVYFLVSVNLVLWKKFRAKKLKSLFALLLLSICICLAMFAAKGNEMAVFFVTLFDKAGKIYKVLGHFLSIFGGTL